jgi:hypothetical protein
MQICMHQDTIIAEIATRQYSVRQRKVDHRLVLTANSRDLGSGAFV